MKVERIEVLVEEPSAEAALETILPKMIGDTSFKIHSHQGKPDLLAKLPNKLRAYASWIPASYRILVVVDQSRAPHDAASGQRLSSLMDRRDAPRDRGIGGVVLR